MQLGLQLRPSGDRIPAHSQASRIRRVLPQCRAAQEGRSDEYSKTMNQNMGSTLTYRHEDGMNFAAVMDDLLVGSCLQTPADADRLADEEGVGAVLCLQEDSDMDWFKLDVAPIQARCKERGDIEHIRFRIRDFDPFDVRIKLPAAVQIVADQVAQKRKVYIHCTAGMGRAPATALAFMFYCRGVPLQEAFRQLTAVRACNPRVLAIRQAACDILLDGGVRQRCRIAVRNAGTASQVQVAGLDVGWGQRLDLPRSPVTHRFEVERELPVGRFPYKLLFDGHWTWSADHPRMKDGDAYNNFVEVVGSAEGAAARQRLLAPDGDLTADERQRMAELFAAGMFRT